MEYNFKEVLEEIKEIPALYLEIFKSLTIFGRITLLIPIYIFTTFILICFPITYILIKILDFIENIFGGFNFNNFKNIFFK